jgi:RNA polymerase sigma-70 factor (ECF subfamily)
MSYAQAAAILEIPVGTVMSRLARGRATLRQLLNEPVADNKQQIETCSGPAR